MEETQLPEVWNDFRLDQRVLEAIRALGWRKPTMVQRACVSQLLRGRDVCVQSRTGSGKTGAFSVPLAQRLCTRLASGDNALFALVLVPSVELCSQTEGVITSLTKYLTPKVVVDNLCANKGSLQPGSHVIVATPAAIAKGLRANIIDGELLRTLQMLIIDEADLLVSMTSLRIVQSLLPTSGLQRVLLSATLTESVASMKGQLLRNPTHITLTEDEVGGSQAVTSLSDAKRGYQEEADDGDAIVEARMNVKEATKSSLKQYYLVATDECHHHTLLYALYRMGFIEGRTLIFMDEEESTYRLQHFLEQLSVACVVYDTSLPTNTRLDMLRRFLTGEVSTLICTDGTLEKAERAQLDVADDDKESGLHRGIDFSKVRNVIIYDGIDQPTSMNFAKYTHRVGRTGRAGNPGKSILFMSVQQAQKAGAPLREYCKSRGESCRAFKDLERSKASQLQYRVDSVLANVTRNATRRLRVATVASEIARSNVLSTQMNPGDTEALRKVVAKAKKSVRADRDILNVPDYMRVSKKVDDAAEYTRRVKGAAEIKANVFARVAKRQREDPLKQVVAKVRRKEKEKK